MDRQATIRTVATKPFESTAKLAEPRIVMLPQPRADRQAAATQGTAHNRMAPLASQTRPVVEQSQRHAAVQQVEDVKRPDRILKNHSVHPQPPVPNTSQWIRRTRDDAGSERIEGTARVSFAAGQRQATLHIPFIPPLESVPQIECHAVDGAPDW